MSVLNHHYDTLSAATQSLKARGYNYEFSVDEAFMLIDAHDPALRYGPHEIHVDEFQRFEGPSDPADMTVIYALATPSGQKGILIDAFGPNSDEQIDGFVKGLRLEHGAQDEGLTDNRS